MTGEQKNKQAENFKLVTFYFIENVSDGGSSLPTFVYSPRTTKALPSDTGSFFSCLQLFLTSKKRTKAKGGGMPTYPH